jgi:hypothetical protein
VSRPQAPAHDHSVRLIYLLKPFQVSTLACRLDDLTGGAARKILIETGILAFILILPVLVFVSILSNPGARNAEQNGAYLHSLNGLHSFTLQSRENVEFADAATLSEGLKGYYAAWPPLYPTVLYLLNRLGIAPLLCNLFIYVLNVIWFSWILGKLGLKAPERFLLIAAYAAGAFHYHNLATQIVSEGLFLLLVQLSFSALMRYRRRNSWAMLFALAALSSLAILTKYIALFWVVPVVLLGIIVSTKGALAKARNSAIYAAVSAALALPWFIYIYRATGYLSGWDRSEERQLEQLTDFLHNLFYTVKAAYIDFFSRDWAAKMTMRRDFPFQAWDWLMLVVLAFVVSVICIMIWRSFRKTGRPGRKGFMEWIDGCPYLALLSLFSASYLVCLLVLWTFGNNDPIYSRFLYPWYPFVLLTLAGIYQIKAQTSPGSLSRSAFFLLFMAVLASQVYKSVVLCIRYL